VVLIMCAPFHLGASAAHATIHSALWEFDVDSANTTDYTQCMLVLGRRDINLKAWPAAAAARCSCVFATATPTALGERLLTWASVPQATLNAQGKAASSPNAAEAVPLSGSTYSGNKEADPDSRAHGDVASTVNRLFASA
jgi:hypothetical protein